MGSLYAAAHKFASWFAAAHESVSMCAAARKVAKRGKEGQALVSLRGVYYRGRESCRERRGGESEEGKMVVGHKPEPLNSYVLLNSYILLPLHPTAPDYKPAD